MIDESPDGSCLEDPVRVSALRTHRVEKAHDWRDRVTRRGKNSRGGWRRRLKRSERTTWRVELHKMVQTQPELVDTPIVDVVAEHHNRYVGAGRMRPWLQSQCGQPWDEVYAKLCEIFDSRQYVGREVREHVPYEVDLVEQTGSRFFVDQAGILCAREERNVWRRRKRAQAKQQTTAAPSRERIDRLRQGRRIMRRDGKLYWMGEFEQTRLVFHHFDTVRWRSVFAPRVSRPHGKRLTRSEVELMEAYLARMTPDISLEDGYREWSFDEEQVAA